MNDLSERLRNHEEWLVSNSAPWIKLFENGLVRAIRQTGQIFNSTEEVVYNIDYVKALISALYKALPFKYLTDEEIDYFVDKAVESASIGIKESSGHMAVFDGEDLSGKEIKGCLYGAAFSNCNLTRVDMVGSVLAFAVLNNCTVVGLEISTEENPSILTPHSRFDHELLRSVDFSYSAEGASYIDASTPTNSGLTLKERVLDTYSKWCFGELRTEAMSKASITLPEDYNTKGSFIMTGCNGQNVIIEKASLAGATIIDGDLPKLSLNGSALNSFCLIADTNAPEISLHGTTSGLAVFNKVFMPYADARGSKLQNVIIQNCNINYINFAPTNDKPMILESVTIQDSSAKDANFDDAMLFNCTILCTNYLPSASFDGTVFGYGTTIDYASIEGVDLSNAIISYEQISDFLDENQEIARMLATKYDLDVIVSMPALVVVDKSGREINGMVFDADGARYEAPSGWRSWLAENPDI